RTAASTGRRSWPPSPGTRPPRSAIDAPVRGRPARAGGGGGLRALARGRTRGGVVAVRGGGHRAPAGPSRPLPAGRRRPSRGRREVSLAGDAAERTCEVSGDDLAGLEGVGRPMEGSARYLFLRFDPDAQGVTIASVEVATLPDLWADRDLGSARLELGGLRR